MFVHHAVSLSERSGTDRDGVSNDSDSFRRGTAEDCSPHRQGDLAWASIRSRLRSALLDEGSTVPFIARYRKEATGNLDDTQLRTLEERLLYLRELEERRAAILASIEEQGKLTDELRGAIEAAATKQTLEDIYLPYKPKRRTRAQIAREAGLEPLADALFADPTLDPRAGSGEVCECTSPPATAWRPSMCPTRKPRSKARATFWSSVLPKPPSCSPSCVPACGTRASSRPR